MKARTLSLLLLLLVIGTVSSAGVDEHTIRILCAPAPFDAPHMVLRDQGLLDRALKPFGWKVTWITKPMTEPLAAQALASGALDIAVLSDSAAVIARAHGNDMKLYKPLSVAPKAYAIVVPAKAGADNLKALTGAKIGLPVGTDAHYLLGRAMAAAGLSLAKVAVVDMPYAEALAAVSRNGIRAAVLAEPFLSKAVNSGAVRILRDGEGLIEGAAITALRRKFFENEEMMDVYGEVMARLYEYMAANPADVSKIAARETGLPANVLNEIMAKHHFLDLSQAQMLKDLTSAADFLAAQGLIDRRLTLNDLVGCNCNK